MKKTLIYMLALLTLASCQSTCSDKTEVTPVDTEKKAPPEEPEEPEEIPDLLEVPEDFAAYLESKMPTHTIVDKADWVTPEYLDGFSRGNQPRYSEDILIAGDFNGDYEEDFATFLQDSKGRRKLFAFHKNGNSYKRYELKTLPISGVLGAGLETGDTGFVANDNKESSGLEYNTINYKEYDGGETVYYWDGRKYRNKRYGN